MARREKMPPKQIRQDHYSVLNLPKNSSPEEVRASFHELALQFHPDKNGGSEESTEKFKKVAEAFEILSGPKKRFEYDAEMYEYPEEYGLSRKDVSHPSAPRKTTKKEERKASKAKRADHKTYQDVEEDEVFWFRSGKTFDIKYYMYDAKSKSKAARDSRNNFQPKLKKGVKWAAVTVDYKLAGDDDIKARYEDTLVDTARKYGTWTDTSEIRSNMDAREDWQEQRASEEPATMRILEAPDFSEALMRATMDDRTAFSESMGYTRYRGIEMLFEPINNGAHAMDKEAIEHLLSPGPFEMCDNKEPKDFSDNRTSSYKKMVKHFKRTGSVLTNITNTVETRKSLIEEKDANISSLIKGPEAGAVVKNFKLKLYREKKEMRGLIEAQKKDKVKKRGLTAKNYALKKQVEQIDRISVPTEEELEAIRQQEMIGQQFNSAREEARIAGFDRDEAERRVMGRCTFD